MKRHSLLPFGTWPSPISAEDAAKSGLRFGHMHVDMQAAFLAAANPEEKGRTSLLKVTLTGSVESILPAFFSMKSQVHEYGGKAFMVEDGICVISSAEDQQLHLLNKDGELKPLTEATGHRFIDFVFHPSKEYLIAVVEDHTSGQVMNSLQKIDLKTGKMTALSTNYDFYAYPRISPDGKKLAWISWDHPYMPWDSSEILIAELTETGLKNPFVIAGTLNESTLEPQWKTSDSLYFVSDRNLFWNLYCYDITTGTTQEVTQASYDIGLPLWVFGNKRYCFTHDGKIAYIATDAGYDTLYLLDEKTKEIKKIELPFTTYSELYELEGQLIFLAASVDLPLALYSFDREHHKLTMLLNSSSYAIDPENISKPLPIHIKTKEGHTTYGFYYPPKLEGLMGAGQEKPPLIVKCHGGPTAQTSARLTLETLFFTTRGFGVLDMNYAGSTGYGREYRKKLHHMWGVADVLDCIEAAKYLADQGLVDANRMVIKGGSAGGFTSLCAVAFHQVFQAATVFYGVCDAATLVEDTHKFEKHYLDELIGPYPAMKALYEERSPLHHADSVKAAVLFFHGNKDTVVPVSQATKMHEILAKNKRETKLITFEDEGHGFRSALTLQRVYEEELQFYQRIFSLDSKNPS